MIMEYVVDIVLVDSGSIQESSEVIKQSIASLRELRVFEGVDGMGGILKLCRLAA